MEMIGILVQMLALGAWASKDGVVSDAASTAYRTLRDLIERRYPKVPIDLLDRTPQSRRNRDLVRRQLEAGGAENDAELLNAANRLVVLLEQDVVGHGLGNRGDAGTLKKWHQGGWLPTSTPADAVADRDLHGGIVVIGGDGGGLGPVAADRPADLATRQQEPRQEHRQQSRNSDQQQRQEQQQQQRSSDPRQRQEQQQQQQQQQQQRQQEQQRQQDPLTEDGSSARMPEPSARTIDAHLVVAALVPGEIASLTVTLRLPASQAFGQFRQSVVLPTEQEPVTVLLEVKGFTILSEPPPPLALAIDRDSAPAAFQLRVEKAARRWLHIVLVQAGQCVGELAIHDFSAINGESRRPPPPMRRVQEADLTLIVRSAEASATVSSPRNRACLDHQPIPGIKPLATPFRTMLRDRLRALYDATADASDTERELQIVGVELAKCLSPDLDALLRRPDVRTVMLRHDEDFEFPLELCYLDDPVDPFFVGDRIAICRWYLGVTNPPDIVSKGVRRVAFLQGGDRAALPDEAMLKRLYHGRTTTLGTSKAVRDTLFKSSDFDLIHFTGHCKVTDNGIGGLEMADGSLVRMIDIGQLLAERAFTKAQPFVLLNACSSAQPYIGLTARDSFAHRFVTAEACAFIGTLWPVAGSVANDFAKAFYDALRKETVGTAMLLAKLAIVKAAQDAADAPGSNVAAVARQVAARSYCMFAHPDLRLARVN